MGIYYEPQISRKGGRWWLTVCISAGESQWTNRAIMLDGETEEEAWEEATQQVMALRAALQGQPAAQNPPSPRMSRSPGRSMPR